VLATVLQNSRFFYCTGRDVTWHPRINDAFTATHDRYNSPWIATLAAGIFSMAACFVGLQVLLVVTGTSIAIVYAIMCIAAIVGRHSGTSNHAAYRMPLYPLLPVLGLLALAYVFYTSAMDPAVGQPSLIANAVIVVLSLGYYALVIRRKGGWMLREP
jgi:amino acid transporter